MKKVLSLAEVVVYLFVNSVDYITLRKIDTDTLLHECDFYFPCWTEALVNEMQLVVEICEKE